MKNRLNLTINEELLLKAKKHASKRGVSLSSIVEEGLSKTLAPDTNIDIEKALSNFHKRALGNKFKEPSDKLVKDILESKKLKGLL